MTLWQFIFFIIGRFNILTQDQYEGLVRDIKSDWDMVETDETKPTYKKSWKATVKKMEAGPYRRLLLAVLAIPAVKWINDWLLSKPEQEEEEEEKKNPLDFMRRNF